MTAVLLFAATAAYADDDAATKRPEHKITQSDSYTMIEPMYATVMENGRARGLLMVAVGIDVPDLALRAEAARAMPVLRDAYVRSLVSFTAAAVRPWQQPDVDIIARRLQIVTDRTLHRPGARVLLAQVALRITK